MESNKPDKIKSYGTSIALYVADKYHMCEQNMASLFLGNDDHNRGYCVAGAKVNGEYHIFDEVIGRLSPDFINDLKDMLGRCKIDRVILACDDEDLRNRMRKELGIRFIYESERKRNNASVLMREWFCRNKPGTEDALLRIWDDCVEAVKSNYPPTRDCIVRLLDFYDKRMRAKDSKRATIGGRAGYG
jgi:hypothetical protein